MAYNLRTRSIAETLRNEEDNHEIWGGSDSESEDYVSEQEESDEYRVSDDGSDTDDGNEMAMDWENSSLSERLLSSRARGRPTTQLKGKNGFVWSTNLPQRQSGMFSVCVYICSRIHNRSRSASQ